MKPVFFLTFLFVFFSCKDPEQEKNEVAKKPLLSVVKKHQTPMAVKSSFNQNIDAWEEYQALHGFMPRYLNVSPNEALSNALELKELVKNLKKKRNPTILETPSFKARVNVFYNEVLRLVDMTYISAITAEEVNKQVAKVLITYSAINAKINTVFAQQNFERSIDINTVFIGLDSSKIKRASLNSLKLIDQGLRTEKPPSKRRSNTLKKPASRKQQ